MLRLQLLVERRQNVCSGADGYDAKDTTPFSAEMGPSSRATPLVCHPHCCSGGRLLIQDRWLSTRQLLVVVCVKMLSLLLLF